MDARGHGDRPHAMSALWLQATRTASSAPPVSTHCPPRDACGGINLRLVMSPRGPPRRPQPMPSWVSGALWGTCVSAGSEVPDARGNCHASPGLGAPREVAKLRSHLCASRSPRLWLRSHPAPRATIPIEMRYPVMQQLSATTFSPSWLRHKGENALRWPSGIADDE
jgi:hypothetical protein